MSDCMEAGEGVFGSEYNGEFRGTAVSVKRRSSVVLDDPCKKKAVPTEPGFHQFGENAWHNHLVRHFHNETDFS